MVDRPKSIRRREKSQIDVCCLLIEARNMYPDDHEFLVTLGDFLMPVVNPTLSPPYDQPGRFAAGHGLFEYLSEFKEMAGISPEKMDNIVKFLGTLIFDIEATITYMRACSGTQLVYRKCDNNKCDQYCSLIRKYMHLLFTSRSFRDYISAYRLIVHVLFQPIVYLKDYYTTITEAPEADAFFISEMAMGNCIATAMAEYASDIISTVPAVFTARVACPRIGGCLVWDFNAANYPMFYLTYDVDAVSRMLRVFYRLGQLHRYLYSRGYEEASRVLGCWAVHVALDAGESLWSIVDDYLTSRNLWGQITVPRDLVEVIVTYTPLAAFLNVTSYERMSRELQAYANECFACPWGEVRTSEEVEDICSEMPEELPYSMYPVQCLDKYDEYFRQYGYERPNLPAIEPSIIRRTYTELRRVGAPIVPPIPILILRTVSLELESDFY